MEARNFACLLLLLLGTCLHNTLRAGCIDSVSYHVAPAPCYGGRATLYIDSVYSVKHALFSVDSVSFSTRKVIDNLWPGPHRLYIRNLDADTCIFAIDFEVPEPEPFIVTLWAYDTTIISGTWIELHADIAPDNTVLQDIEWRPPVYFPNPDTLVQRIRPMETDSFYVILHNSNGCPAQARIVIHVEESPVYVPNAFSPYSLYNDVFTVFADSGVPRVRWLRVFSRTGAMVFERYDFIPNDPSVGWDGHLSNRSLAQPGVYTWMCEVEYWNGAVRQFWGDVTVFR